jgi:hypothetical protein
LSNEPSDSVIRFSSSTGNISFSLSLLNFLKLNKNFNYNCIPLSCNSTHRTIGNSDISKSFVINSSGEIVGIKLITPAVVSSITNFSLKFSSDVSDSCSASPLLIQFLEDYNKIEWQSSKSSGNFNCNNNKYGFYDSGYAEVAPATISNSEFCSKFSLGAFPEIKIGADISGTGLGGLAMRIEGINNSLNGNCYLSASASGEFSCVVNQSSLISSDYYVCIRKINGTDYTIDYDKHNAVGYWQAEGLQNKYDWKISAEPASFSAIGTIQLEKEISNLENEIFDYLQNSYGSSFDCTNGCILPLKLISNSGNQNINVFDLSLKYFAGPSQVTETGLFNLTLTPALINMPFAKVAINNSGVKTPLVSGIYNVSVFLNSIPISTNKIEVLSIPLIFNITPDSAPAALDTTFSALVSGVNITSYTWNFGDNTNAVTNVSSVIHDYPAVGRYLLSLIVTNQFGNSNFNISVNVVSPKDYLNQTFVSLKIKIANLKSQISGFSDFLKNYITQNLKLTDYEIQLTSLEVNYNAAGNDSQRYIAIANSLKNISLYDSIKIDESSSGTFIINRDSVNGPDISIVSGENESYSSDKVKDSVFSWFTNSLIVNGDVKSYSLISEGQERPFVSYVSLRLKPKTNVGVVYLIFNQIKDSVVLSNSLSGAYLGNVVGVPIDLSSGEKNIEFIILGKTSLLDLPIYFTPKLSELNLNPIYAECNFNRICESERNEDSNNCRNDCKPVGKIVLWLFVILFIVFWIYIGLQEWYKRNYENYLFKDKNDLYNLTHFIGNAESENIRKEDIFSRLIAKSWHREQLVFAYNKYHGRRTGMWEIPIFKFIENRRVAKEIDLRNRMGMNPSMPPKPIRPFFPAVQNGLQKMSFQNGNNNLINNSNKSLKTPDNK